jgi:septum formation protein
VSRQALILASASARRHRLLGEAGLVFEVAPSDVDETLVGPQEPEAAARELARRKLGPLGAQARRRPRPGVFALGADTIVAVAGGAGSGWELLGKPQDAAEAQRFLERLAGTRHQVVTGIACLDLGTGLLLDDAERTWVHMRPIETREVLAYVASGEWRGKAGGYAIQETADAFVTELEGGGFDNVVGLPVARTLALLERSGVRLADLRELVDGDGDE